MFIDALVYHIASGRVFFTGVILLLVVIGLLEWFSEDSRWRRRLAIPVVLGVIVIGISATPLPWWLYGIMAIGLLVWGIVESWTAATARRKRLGARLLVFALLIGTVAWEVPYHLPPRLNTDEPRAVAVIADSVTAGIGEDEAVAWPELLRRAEGVSIHDHSEMGATVESALEQAELLTPEDGIVILEIGGNDLLGGTSAEDFERGLAALLEKAASPGRTLIMFELPLPPGRNRYGLIQRRLANKYDVLLIPKRVLMGVLTEGGATLDSIHLTQPGHAEMAAAVWEVIGPVFSGVQH